MFRTYKSDLRIFNKAGIRLTGVLPYWPSGWFETDTAMLSFGGVNTGNANGVTDIHKSVYATNVTTKISSTMPTARGMTAVGGNDLKCFTFGGLSAASIYPMFRTTYATEVCSTIYNAPYQIQRAAGCGGILKAYIGGGAVSYNSQPSYNVCEIVYSTEVASTISSAGLSIQREHLGLGCSRTTVYYGPGLESQRMVDKMTFASETTVQLSSVALSANKYGYAVFNSFTNMYFAAGNSSPQSVENMTFSTETFSSLGNIYSVAITNTGGSQSTTAGINVGGWTTTYYAGGWKFDFATNTPSAQSSLNLTQAVSDAQSAG